MRLKWEAKFRYPVTVSHCPWISAVCRGIQNIALCNKSNGRCDIKAEKREELESKSSHKSDIWLPAASKKWGEIYWKYIFQTLEAIFPYKGVFVTKVVKANIIAFIKTKILRPVLSVTNPPFQKCQPLLHSALDWECPQTLPQTPSEKDILPPKPLPHHRKYQGNPMNVTLPRK